MRSRRQSTIAGSRDIVKSVSDAASYRLLETLAAAVADALSADLPVMRVRVSVRKPGVAWAEWTGVTCRTAVTRSRYSARRTRGANLNET